MAGWSSAFCDWFAKNELALVMTLVYQLGSFI